MACRFPCSSYRAASTASELRAHAAQEVPRGILVAAKPAELETAAAHLAMGKQEGGEGEGRLSCVAEGLLSTAQGVLLFRAAVRGGAEGMAEGMGIGSRLGRGATCYTYGRVVPR